MLKKYWIAFLILAPFIVGAQGIEFFHGSWEETLTEANEQNKLIFVDAYAVWCGPCKKMSKLVFPQEEVGEYFNRHFVSVKIDMERGEGLKFGKKYPVRAYPTFFFISPSGEVVLSVTGYRQAEDFLEVGRKAIERYDPSAELAKQYEDGDRSFEVVLAYIKSLNKSGQSSLAVSNQYLREQKDLTETQRLEFIYEAAVEADSRIFNMFIENRDALNKLKSKTEVDQQIERACQNTVMKSIEFEMIELLQEAQNQYRKHLPAQAEAFTGETNLVFAGATGNPDLFQTAAKEYISGSFKNEVDHMNLISYGAITHFEENPEVLAFVEKIAKKAYQKFDHPRSGYYYAKILQLQNETAKALEVIGEILSNSKEDPSRDLMRLKEQLENS